MIFYNWKLVKQKGGRSANNIVRIMKHITFKKIPYCTKSVDYKISMINWSGTDFLLNPERLISSLYRTDIHLSKRDFCVYLELASRRSYHDYKISKDTSLDIRLAYDFESYITRNKGLQIENNRVHFLFEKPNNKKD